MKRSANNRARAAIIYSHNRDSSGESRQLAHYLCGLLASTGYCYVYLVGLDNNNATYEHPSNLRIRYCHKSGGKMIEAPV